MVKMKYVMEDRAHIQMQATWLQNIYYAGKLYTGLLISLHSTLPPQSIPRWSIFPGNQQWELGHC